MPTYLYSRVLPLPVLLLLHDGEGHGLEGGHADVKAREVPGEVPGRRERPPAQPAAVEVAAVRVAEGPESQGAGKG